MSHEIALPVPVRRRFVWLNVWLLALRRPTVVNYSALAAHSEAHLWRACLWLFGGSALGGVASLLQPLLMQTSDLRYFDALLLPALLLSALLAVLAIAGFALTVYAAARVLRGAGTLGQYAYVFAAFSSPLMIVAGVLAVLPWSRELLAGLYTFWLALYLVAVRAVSGMKLLRSLFALGLGLVTLGAAALGVALVVGYSGILVP